jgi:hypothetical protein
MCFFLYLPAVVGLIAKQQCCGSGAFLNSGSGIGFFRISDPKPILFIESLMTIFWVKSLTILGKIGPNFFIHKFKNKIFNFLIFVATKNIRQQIFFHHLLLLFFYPRSGMDKNLSPKGALKNSLHTKICNIKRERDVRWTADNHITLSEPEFVNG